MRCLICFSLALGILWVTSTIYAIQSTTANIDEPIKDRIAYPLSESNLTGTWYGADRAPTGVYTFTLQLVQTNNIITGTYVWSDGPTGPVSGTVDGVNVTWTRSDPDREYTAYFTGTISDEDRFMVGAWVDSWSQSGIWQAIRNTSAPFALLNLPYDYPDSTFYDQSRDTSQDGNIGSFFDHLYPTSNEPPNLGLDQAINFNGYDSSQTLPLPSYQVVTDGNDGINFMLAAGTPVLSAATGVVTFIGQVPGYCELTHQVETANVIKILHANYYVSEYWHLSSFATDLVTDTVVTRDSFQPIGYAGDTGCTTEPLLHFVVRNPSGMVVDPYGWRPLPFSAWYGSTDPWQQYNTDNGGVDAVSHYLWLEPLNTITITHPSISTTLSSPSSEISVTLASGFYSETLRFDLSETLQPALIDNYRSLRTFTFFGYTSQEAVITELYNAVTIELAGPNADQMRAITQGLLSMPALRVWDEQQSDWVGVPITWDPLTGHIHGVTSRIGSFALTTSPPNVYLPLTRK